MGHLWLKWVGHLWLKWMGQLVTVFGRYAQKNTGLHTLSGPRMTTGFGPFELPTRGLLQKGPNIRPHGHQEDSGPYHTKVHMARSSKRRQPSCK